MPFPSFLCIQHQFLAGTFTSSESSPGSGRGQFPPFPFPFFLDITPSLFGGFSQLLPQGLNFQIQEGFVLPILLESTLTLLI